MLHTNANMSSSTFRFLDLPKDIRLMVYDLLTTRTHRKIMRHEAGKTAAITLVAPDSIPPLHLTCKALSAEATPFLRAKVERMATPHTTPRLIVHAGFPKLLDQSNSIFHEIT